MRDHTELYEDINKYEQELCERVVEILNIKETSFYDLPANVGRASSRAAHLIKRLNPMVRAIASLTANEAKVLEFLLEEYKSVQGDTLP